MEYELKYAATPDAVPEAVLEDPRVTAALKDRFNLEMETTYYDTRGSSLREARMTLRCRRESDRRVVTFKAPSGRENARLEWEVEAGSLAEGIPLLLAQGAPELLGQSGEFVPVCGARFTRRGVLLQLEDCSAELAFDRGVLFRGEKSLPFSELELELKSGEPAAMEALGNALCREYGLHTEPKSKYFRAVSL